ncbi:helical backbone metal receptor [Thiomonas bhubaneswarensis]|uniref:ABC-type Fe3+-hydroxamate transport system, periplasmic component n=1 Tax=Thiomonas bhubaneswarensis TaxID=339866 RepID=A0A0K6IBF2_9BURK|nr:helical backbone metal receptor [Thiomonas bhubaneswarensis]CUB00444.1 ABC-type Fe3+-hydroxamate transport system, periplasmic component [Thiomonas bhubaneswarensis]
MPLHDAIGQPVVAAGPQARIASLVPSLTETLFALGLQAQIVARTGFCIHPRDQVGAVPKVGGTKDVHLDALRSLRPSHVLVNVDENTRDTVEALRRFVPQVIVTHPQTPEDNLALFDLLGAAFAGVPGVPERAAALRKAMRLALDSLPPTPPPHHALYLIWRQPWMTVARDTYISRSLAAVGLHTLPDVRGGDGLHQPGSTRYPAFDWSADWLTQVDTVLLSSEPYRFGPRHADEVRELLARRGLHPAVHCIPGEWASWYGVRTIDGLRQLAAFSSRLTAANAQTRYGAAAP